MQLLVLYRVLIFIADTKETDNLYLSLVVMDASKAKPCAGWCEKGHPVHKTSLQNPLFKLSRGQLANPDQDLPGKPFLLFN